MIRLLTSTILVLCLAAPVAAQSTRPATRPTATDYQPGIRINWADRQVEVDAKVILREGLIELFACSPGTREHESIVLIESRPLHVYQALGLIGLLPGHPVRYDPVTEVLEPATGDPVEVLIRFPWRGRIRTEAIEHWLRLTGRGVDRITGRPGLLPWVFAGSSPASQDAITADEEGTVIALVNFGSAIVALNELHPASNADLWLEPDTDSIPALDTPCTLIFRPGPLRLAIDREGQFVLAGKTVPMADVARRATAFLSGEPRGRFRVSVHPKTPPRSKDRLLGLLNSLDAAPGTIEWIETTEAPAASKPAHSVPERPASRLADVPWAQLERFWAETLETVRRQANAQGQGVRQFSRAIKTHVGLWQGVPMTASSTSTCPATKTSE